VPLGRLWVGEGEGCRDERAGVRMGKWRRGKPTRVFCTQQEAIIAVVAKKAPLFLRFHLLLFCRLRSRCVPALPPASSLLFRPPPQLNMAASVCSFCCADDPLR
jgi:hypothetical protein